MAYITFLVNYSNNKNKITLCLIQSILPWDFKNYQLVLGKDKETDGIRAKVSHPNVGSLISSLALNLKISIFGINIF